MKIKTKLELLYFAITALWSITTCLSLSWCAFFDDALHADGFSLFEPLCVYGMIWIPVSLFVAWSELERPGKKFLHEALVVPLTHPLPFMLMYLWGNGTPVGFYLLACYFFCVGAANVHVARHIVRENELWKR